MSKNELIIAEKSERLINFIFDMSAILILWIIFVIIIIILGFYPTLIEDDGEQAYQYFVIFFIPVFWSYYFFTEYKFQRTLGKLLTKTKVVNLTGNKPTAIQILIKTLCRSVPFDHVSFLMGFTGIHDQFSKTRVIRN